MRIESLAEEGYRGALPPRVPAPRSTDADAGMGVPSIMVGGLPIAVIDRVRSAALMIARALGRRGAGRPPIVITSANGQVLSLCARDPQIRELFLAADFIHADGTPMVFASRFEHRRPTTVPLWKQKWPRKFSCSALQLNCPGENRQQSFHLKQINSLNLPLQVGY